MKNRFYLHTKPDNNSERYNKKIITIENVDTNINYMFCHIKKYKEIEIKRKYNFWVSIRASITLYNNKNKRDDKIIYIK